MCEPYSSTLPSLSFNPYYSRFETFIREKACKFRVKSPPVAYRVDLRTVLQRGLVKSTLYIRKQDLFLSQSCRSDEDVSIIVSFMFSQISIFHKADKSMFYSNNTCRWLFCHNYQTKTNHQWWYRFQESNTYNLFIGIG